MRILILLLAVACRLAPAATPPPNVVLFIADDLGWNGTSVRMIADNPSSASTVVRTPALERLAKEGMTFSQAYAPHSMCGPTRHALQFGRSPGGMGIAGQYMTRLPEAKSSFMNTLKAAVPAYRAAHFGKWNLRIEPASLGYDDSDGLLGNQDGASGKPDDPKWIFWLTERADRFITAQTEAKAPFYLQLSHFAMHPSGAEARPETLRSLAERGVTGRPAIAYGMAEDLDAGLGLLLDRVDELGIGDNTYFIFTSDNGGGSRRRSGTTGPLKGGKGILTEGGVRVPFVIRGPGIKPGSRSDVPMIGQDLLPTVLDWAGSKSAAPETWEGGSIASVVAHPEGKGAVERGYDAFVWHLPRVEVGGVIDQPHSAIRKGDFKLVHIWAQGRSELYRVSEDIGETKDLAPTESERVKALLGELEAYLGKYAVEGELDALRKGERAGGGGRGGRGGGAGGTRPER